MHPVSVIVPAYNESAERTAAAVSSALEAGAAEILIIDDGSEQCQAPVSTPNPSAAPILVTLPHHVGLARALNIGMSLARAPWISWLSCGDRATPNRYARQIAYAERTGAVCVFGQHVEDGDVWTPREDWEQALWRDNQWSMSTAIWRASASRYVRFDEWQSYCVDWKFALQMQLAYGWDYMPEVVCVATGRGGMTEQADGTTRHLDRVRVAQWATANRPWGKDWQPRWGHEC